MSDTPLFQQDDGVADVEALLSELESADLELMSPPDDVWAGIEAAIRDDSHGEIVSISSARSRFSTSFLAAAAAVAIITVGAVVVATLRGEGRDDAVVASAELAYDAAAFDPLGADAAATARLVERDGRFEIRLDDAALPDPDTDDLELWLIAVTADGSLDVQPVSLIDPTSPGTYEVPAGLDPDVYSIVDISVEPRDGDATHSGRSILRGTLDDV